MSLTNEPEKLVNTALDTFSQILNIECCWVQTISGAQNQLLSLAADRGFSDEMRAEITAIDMRHDFSRRIVGIGDKIVIPDLNNDGVYGLSSFRKAGYKWLVAVPLMTYRAFGLLGAASHNKKLLEKETAELIMVIAGLIANSLSKAQLTRTFQPQGKTRDTTVEKPKKETPPALKQEIKAVKPEVKGEAVLKALLPETSKVIRPEIKTGKPEIKAETVPKAPLPETNKVTKPEIKATKLETKNEAIPKTPLPVVKAKKTTTIPPTDTATKKNPPKQVDPAFHTHKNKMETFRKSHK